MAEDPNLLFERLTNFGGTVAGETSRLALIAIVASWLIIIAYLWFRFKSLTYGLAAVLAEPAPLDRQAIPHFTARAAVSAADAGTEPAST